MKQKLEITVDPEIEESWYFPKLEQNTHTDLIQCHYTGAFSFCALHLRSLYFFQHVHVMCFFL